jgi:3-phenylpropionate/trans-cinnamate dioxygenase ferredoxin component
MSAQLACYASDVPTGGTLRVELEGEAGPVEVAMVRDEAGELHAISDICSHGAVSLSEGEVEDCTIECWLHGSRFDLRTGRPTGLPATRPVPTYPVKIDGDDVWVAVRDSVATSSLKES